MTNFDGLTCLHLAALNNRQDVVEILVNKYNANLNCRDRKSGETILHKAIGELNVDLVKLILNLSDKKTDPDQRHLDIPDYSGRSPLDKVRATLNSLSDHETDTQKLLVISQILSERVRACIQTGCPTCSSLKSEKNLARLSMISERGKSLDDEDISFSSSSSSSSCSSDSEDFDG